MCNLLRHPPDENLSANLIYDLPSIIEAAGFPRLFRSGSRWKWNWAAATRDGFAIYAKLHPERNFIGVERLLGRIRKLDRKGRRIGLANLRGVRIESSYFLAYLLPPHSVSALHVYFPDPWPKQRHQKNRLVNEQFPKIAQAALTPGGVVYLRTDDDDYFAQMTGVFAADTEFRKIESPSGLAELPTDFEKEFHARHHPYPLAQDRMWSCAPVLDGEHDFSAFAASDERDGEGHTKYAPSSAHGSSPRRTG